nr:ricin-type beta-trefoil lectin domain protein [Streptomyces sp. NBC_00886]
MTRTRTSPGPGARSGSSPTYYVGITYVPTYLGAVSGFGEADSLRLSTVAAFAVIVVTPFAGALSDRIGRRPALMLFGALAVVLVTWMLSSSRGELHPSAPAMPVLALASCMGPFAWNLWFQGIWFSTGNSESGGYKAMPLGGSRLRAAAALRAAKVLFTVAVGLVGLVGAGPAVAMTGRSGSVESGPSATAPQSVAAAQSRVVAGGMAVIDRSWPNTANGYDDFETSITITREPGYNGQTFWAHQWGYAKHPEGGYVGLQNRTGNDKYINFSIWGASGWRDMGSGTNCRFFGHEGSGVQCDARYAWQEGVTYRIKVARSGPDGWLASITNTRTGSTSHVATIVLPQDRGGLSTLSQWVENFAQGSNQPASCAVVPPATAIYGRPTANGGTVTPTGSTSRTYGNCASIAKSVCTPEQMCTLTVNQGNLPNRAKLQNIHSNYCLDMLGGGPDAGLWHCQSNANQLLTQDTTYRLTLSGKPGLCLTAETSGPVKSAACANGAAQQWMYMPGGQAYFNAGTGKCLDPLENAALGALLRVYDCLGNSFQKWRPIP